MPYTQPPPKQKEERDRLYLLESEVNQLIDATRKVKRHGNRNATLILMMFRHGLRTQEAVNLKWTQIDLEFCMIYVNSCSIWEKFFSAKSKRAKGAKCYVVLGATHTTRKPRPSLRKPRVMRSRNAEQQISGSLIHEPPRTTFLLPNLDNHGLPSIGAFS